VVDVAVPAAAQVVPVVPAAAVAVPAPVRAARADQRFRRLKRMTRAFEPALFFERCILQRSRLPMLR
jgi:hypothetical protein